MRSVITGLFVVIVLAVMSGCAVPPSNTDIEQAVREGFMKNILLQNPVLDEVRIIDIGKAQNSGDTKCWPVKTHVKFHGYDLIAGRINSQSDNEYCVYKDAYGKWRI